MLSVALVVGMVAVAAAPSSPPAQLNAVVAGVFDGREQIVSVSSTREAVARLEVPDPVVALDVCPGGERGLAVVDGAEGHRLLRLELAPLRVLGAAPIRVIGDLLVLRCLDDAGRGGLGSTDGVVSRYVEVSPWGSLGNPQTASAALLTATPSGNSFVAVATSATGRAEVVQLGSETTKSLGSVDVVEPVAVTVAPDGMMVLVAGEDATGQPVLSRLSLLDDTVLTRPWTGVVQLVAPDLEHFVAIQETGQAARLDTQLREVQTFTIGRAPVVGSTASGLLLGTRTPSLLGFDGRSQDLVATAAAPSQLRAVTLVGTVPLTPRSRDVPADGAPRGVVDGAIGDFTALWVTLVALLVVWLLGSLLWEWWHHWRCR